MHNTEEALRGLSAWMAAQSLGWQVIDQETIDIALLSLTAASWLGFVWVCSLSSKWLRRFVTLCTASAMLVNSVSHLVLSVGTASWMPGAITALVLMGPVCAVVFERMVRSMNLPWRQVGYALAIGVALNATVPLITITTVQFLRAGGLPV